MERVTIKYKDPFLGEVELTRVGETAKNLMGESLIDTIYEDPIGNYWIDTWSTTGGDPIPMKFLRKDLINKIVGIKNNNMSKRIYKQWEDIYPLTLITMRYGGKYVAFNAEEDAGFVQEVNTEEVSYELEDWLDKNVDPCPYGVGNTIMNAMNNLLEKLNNE